MWDCLYQNLQNLETIHNRKEGIAIFFSINNRNRKGEILADVVVQNKIADHSQNIQSVLLTLMHMGILDSVSGDSRVDAYQNAVSALHCYYSLTRQLFVIFSNQLHLLTIAFHFRMKYGLEHESQHHELHQTILYILCAPYLMRRSRLRWIL